MYVNFQSSVQDFETSAEVKKALSFVAPSSVELISSEKAQQHFLGSLASIQRSGRDSTPANRSTAILQRELLSADECQFGGTAIDTGIDENGNGFLDSEEVDQTHILCHSEPGPSSLIMMSSSGINTECPHGGKRLESGVDLNGNHVVLARIGVEHPDFTTT